MKGQTWPWVASPRNRSWPSWPRLYFWAEPKKGGLPVGSHSILAEQIPAAGIDVINLTLRHSNIEFKHFITTMQNCKGISISQCWRRNHYGQVQSRAMCM